MGLTSPFTAIRKSFRAKIFVMTALIIVSISCAFTFFFIRHERQKQTTDLVRQGELLASLLANTSRLAVFAGNQVALEQGAEGILLNRNVISVSIRNSNGNLLTYKVKAGKEHRAGRQGETAGQHQVSDDDTVSITTPIIAGAAQSTADILFLYGEEALTKKIGSVTVSLDKENLKIETRRLIAFALVSMVIFLVLASVLAYIMARGITRPLTALLEAVNVLGSQGVYSSVPVATEDEVGSLASAFNDMAENLKRREQEKRQLEEQLRQAREQEAQKEWQETFDTVPDLIVIMDDAQRIVRINRAMAEHLGPAKESLIGKKCEEVSSHCCLLQHFYTNEPDTRAGTSTQHEIFDEKSGMWYWLTVSPLHRSEWEHAGTVHVARDITLRKKAESERNAIQAKLIQTNKMTSLGLLVSGMAHEVNNPNSNIMFTAHLLSKAWKDAETILDRYLRDEGDFRLGGHSYLQIRETLPYHIAGITENARRIEGIIKNLKDFVRKGKADLAPDVDVNRVVSVSAALINNQIKRYTSHFDLQLAENLPSVRGNAQQLEQVFINVIMNALQALPAKDRHVRVTTLQEKATGSVVVTIEDEGAGMSPEVKASLFEPFFSTKLDSGGTGLGLPISKFILDEHHGRMDICTKPGIGTTVTIVLPALQQEAGSDTIPAV